MESFLVSLGGWKEWKDYDYYFTSLYQIKPFVIFMELGVAYTNAITKKIVYKANRYNRKCIFKVNYVYCIHLWLERDAVAAEPVLQGTDISTNVNTSQFMFNSDVHKMSLGCFLKLMSSMYQSEIGGEDYRNIYVKFCFYK